MIRLLLFNTCVKALITLVLALATSCSSPRSSGDFEEHLPNTQRTWIGPEYWANPLQDWQLNQGRIECIASGGHRNVFLLTHELADTAGSFEMSVVLGRLDMDQADLDSGWIGFEIGIRGEFNDYRDNAVRGTGLRTGITTQGQLFVGNLDPAAPEMGVPLDDILLKLSASRESSGYMLTLSAQDRNGDVLGKTQKSVQEDWLHGGLALVSSYGQVKDMPYERRNVEYGTWGFQPGTERGGNLKFWFDEWRFSGSKLKEFPQRKYGPVLFTQHTLSQGTLKLTAQMAPIGLDDDQEVSFEIKTADTSEWTTVGQSSIEKYSRTAQFRVDEWEGSKASAYRIVYNSIGESNKLEPHYYEGTIRAEPIESDEVVVAAFTGNNDLGFPNNDLVGNVEIQNPDFLFFSGDQIYEGVGGYGVQTAPLDKASLDYLRKWYMFGWTYADLMKERPSVCLPDDHDVYHGNIWGANGRATPPGMVGSPAQDEGGYKMPAEWVNMVQRTQTSHMPDPYDPTPVLQGIGVYYSNLVYGGVSFAIVEDRKFKSAPKEWLPEAQIDNGWPQNIEFNAKTQSDVEGAELLGERQLKFLGDWASDWGQGVWMKAVLSQTIFANLATIPASEFHDRVVPQLRIMKEGEYAEGDKVVADFDSNGWPQTGRNKALREIRKAFAFHIAGDQHLGSTVQYGIDQYGDAGYALCVPSVSNVWPRRWFPPVPGGNWSPENPRYTGDFEDGFGNKITVMAVSNPIYTGRTPSRLYDRATGYGIVRFNRKSRNITIENWERDSDPRTGKPYPDWPLIINQLDNYNRSGAANLPEIRVSGLPNPVVQIVEESANEIVYTIRLRGATIRPIVFKRGLYTVLVGEPGTDQMKTFSSVSTEDAGEQEVLEVEF